MIPRIANSAMEKDRVPELAIFPKVCCQCFLRN